MSSPATPLAHRALIRAGLLLGFALGGFFDGILLHQILQWHHLLSAVAAVQDLRLQVLADGVFHALMYLIAAAGLVVLWRSRAAAAGPHAGRRLWGHAALGFGAWHVVDAVVSHWLTGIHRIRMDAAQPLVWDLLWLAAFGVVPLVAGWWVARHLPRDRRGSSPGAAAMLALCVCVAALVAARPGGRAGDPVMVLFNPGVSSMAAFGALARLDARVVWVDRSGGLWAVHMRDPEDARQLYRDGALLISRSVLAWGCVSWSR